MKTKVISLVLLSVLMFPIMAKSQVKIKQTAGRDAFGEFAPEFARLNDDVLFGEVWSRNDLLSLRDRSIVTVVALMSQGLTDSSFKYHLESAKKNGVTKTEIAEILTHVSFYAGWPKAWAAFRMAKRRSGRRQPTAPQPLRSKPMRRLLSFRWASPTMPMHDISSDRAM